MKQEISAVLAVLLILLQGFPAFAITADEMQEQTETVTQASTSSELFQSEHSETDGDDAESSLPGENNTTVDTPEIQTEITLIPDTPPAFSAKIELIMGGYVLKGTFTDILPNTVQIRPMYSLDGEIYKPIGVDEMSRDWDLSYLGSENPKEQARLQNQICAYSRDEPLNSYLKHGLKRFYIKLQITTETGEYYDTLAAVIEQGTPQPPTENKAISAIFPATMRVLDKEGTPPYAYGKYQITVREGATVEDVYALLPNTLPIEVRISDPDTGVPVTTGIVDCEVIWKELPKLDLTVGKAFTIRDAANELVVPAGTEISTPLGIYVLPESIGLCGSDASDEVRIVLNVIGREDQPDISLVGSMSDDTGYDNLPLSLAFRLKPSGAASVKAYSYVEGDEDWTEICELLSFRDVNANQSAEMFGYVDVLQADESHYAEYLEGEITGFLIGIIIEGGTFDSERVILPWPEEYNHPTRIPELDGSGGNEGNAGSGDGSGDSAEGGQRPDLPDDGAPSETVPPSDNSKPPDNSGSGTSPSKPKNERGTVSPIPPAGPDTVLLTEEAAKDTPPMEIQQPTKPEYPAEHPPVNSNSNALVVQNEPDNKEAAASSPTKTEEDKATEFPVWNVEEPQEKADTQTVTRQISNAEKKVGLPVAASVLLIGGITIVAVVRVRRP